MFALDPNASDPYFLRILRVETVSKMTISGGQNEEKNQQKHNGNVLDITGEGSKVKVLVIPTNEELVIARETVELL